MSGGSNWNHIPICGTIRGIGLDLQCVYHDEKLIQEFRYEVARVKAELDDRLARARNIVSRESNNRTE
jgi:hypothetical protein